MSFFSNKICDHMLKVEIHWRTKDGTSLKLFQFIAALTLIKLIRKVNLTNNPKLLKTA